jgi:hypothetical protein
MSPVVGADLLARVIASASVLVIMSAVGGTDLPGQAHADDTPCLVSAVNAADPCPPQTDPPGADPPHRPRIATFCQPAGPKAGVFCRQQIVP